MIGNFNGAPGVQSWTDYTVSASAAFAAPPVKPPVVQMQPCNLVPNLQSWIILGGALPAQIATLDNPTLCLGIGSQDPNYAALSTAVVPCNNSAAVVWTLNTQTQQLMTPNGLCADVLGVRKNMFMSTVSARFLFASFRYLCRARLHLATTFLPTRARYPLIRLFLMNNGSLCIMVAPSSSNLNFLGTFACNNLHSTPRIILKRSSSCPCALIPTFATAHLPTAMPCTSLAPPTQPYPDHGPSTLEAPFLHQAPPLDQFLRTSSILSKYRWVKRLLVCVFCVRKEAKFKLLKMFQFLSRPFVGCWKECNGKH